MSGTAFPTISTPSGAVPGDAPAWNRQRRSQMPSHRYTDVYSRVAVPLAETVAVPVTDTLVDAVAEVVLPRGASQDTLF